MNMKSKPSDESESDVNEEIEEVNIGYIDKRMFFIVIISFSLIEKKIFNF